MSFQNRCRNVNKLTETRCTKKQGIGRILTKHLPNAKFTAFSRFVEDALSESKSFSKIQPFLGNLLV